MNAKLAALDDITRILQVDKSSQDTLSLRDRICSQQVNWPQVLETANQNFITPSLWSELLKLGMELELPHDVRDYLVEIHRLNTLRNQHLIQQTLEIATFFNAIGIEPILLKGAATLFYNIYPDNGSRMLTDIDILVPRELAFDCWELLRSNGYQPHEDGNSTALHHYPHHLHPLSRAGEYAVVELHHEVLPPVTSGLLYGAAITKKNAQNITASVSANTQRLHCNGNVLRIPSWTSRVLHCLLHSAFLEANAYRAGILPLRSLHELALLQTLHDSEIDWPGISRLLTGSGKQRPLHAWPYLAHRLFGSSLPADWKTSLPMVAHYWRCRWQARWGVSITLRHITRN